MKKKHQRMILAVISAAVFVILYSLPYSRERLFLNIYPSAQPWLGYVFVAMLSVCSFLFFYPTSNRVTVVSGFIFYLSLRFLSLGNIRYFFNSTLDIAFVIILGFLGLGWWIGGK